MNEIDTVIIIGFITQLELEELRTKDSEFANKLHDHVLNILKNHRVKNINLALIANFFSLSKLGSEELWEEID